MNGDNNADVMTAKLEDYRKWTGDNGFAVSNNQTVRLIEETYANYAYALNYGRPISLHEARCRAATKLNFKEVV